MFFFKVRDQAPAEVVHSLGDPPKPTQPAPGEARVPFPHVSLPLSLRYVQRVRCRTDRIFTLAILSPSVKTQNQWFTESPCNDVHQFCLDS